MAARPPKKSETIEIRVPYATKAAFMARCQRRGRSVSEALRGFIEIELSMASSPSRRSGLWQALAAAGAGLAIGAIAAPSLAQTATPSKASFERMDRNQDGALSLAEFQAR